MRETFEQQCPVGSKVLVQWITGYGSGTPGTVSEWASDVLILDADNRSTPRMVIPFASILHLTPMNEGGAR